MTSTSKDIIKLFKDKRLCSCGHDFHSHTRYYPGEEYYDKDVDDYVTTPDEVVDGADCQCCECFGFQPITNLQFIEIINKIKCGE